MSRYLLLALSLGSVVFSHAAASSDWWKNCPGPGCPAKEPGSVSQSIPAPPRDAAQGAAPGMPPGASHEQARQDREAREREQMERERRTRESER